MVLLHWIGVVQMTNRNSDTLESFVKYCIDHPDQRFWQALRNWSGYPFIIGTNVPQMPCTGVLEIVDTFHLEGRRHDDKGTVFPDPPDWIGKD